MIRLLIILAASRFSECVAALIYFLAHVLAVRLAAVNNLHRDFVLVYLMVSIAAALHLGFALFRSDHA